MLSPNRPVTKLWTTSTDGTLTNQDLFLLQNIEPRRSLAIGRRYCHGAGLGATILNSRVDVLAVQWVSFALRVTRMRCHGNSVFPISIPFRCVLWVSAEFCWVLQIGNHCMDSVAIKSQSIVTVLVFFSFLLHATSCILDPLSRIESLLLVPEPSSPRTPPSLVCLSPVRALSRVLSLNPPLAPLH